MLAATTWRIDQWRILTRRELATVLSDLLRRSPNSASTQQNLVIVRLACCCGLRVREIAQLRIGDVQTDSGRPHLVIGPEGAKGGRARRVPLWWDRGTLDDLMAWKQMRLGQGAAGDDCFVTPRGRVSAGPYSRYTLRKRFRTACKALGPERLRRLTIHHGRHTFISHSLAGGRTLAEVRDAAGHTSALTTSAYLHVAVDDEGQVGELFRFGG